jgi:hypothetical protein
MNYIYLIRDWMAVMREDDRTKTQHVALYMTLFQEWNLNYFRNPVKIKRADVMQQAGIGTANFYTKTMKELAEWGYIRYEPSYDPREGSRVYLHAFKAGDDNGDSNGTDTGDDNGSSNGTDTGGDNGDRNGSDNGDRNGSDSGDRNGDDTGGRNGGDNGDRNGDDTGGRNGGDNGDRNGGDNGDRNGSDNGDRNGSDNGDRNGSDNGGRNGRETIYKTNTNNINSLNKLNAYGTSNENSNFVNDRGTDPHAQATGTGNHLRKKETSGGRGAGRGYDIPTTVQEAQEYFLAEHSTADEAEKFCNHYQANGWLIGGRTPMQDWRAAARNWIKNAKKFANENRKSQPKPGPLDNGPKNYAEPY